MIGLVTTIALCVSAVNYVYVVLHMRTFSFSVHTHITRMM